jgi:hypothetical protein
MSERDQYFLQLEKLENSQTLHGSESLRKLLRYLARHAIEHPGIPLKEYQIATEEFGRSRDFDPAVDSMVRVQAVRLRSKLAEYYATEGAHDPIRIELPKGAYTLSFHHRAQQKARGSVGETAEDKSRVTRREKVPRGWLIAVIALSVVLLATLGALFFTRLRAPVASAAGNAPLQRFWKPFLESPGEPWVVFSNAAFIGRPETGMRYFNSAKDPLDLLWDHYTGVGEVLAVHDLDQVFGSLHRTLRVKRGSLFSLDDAKNNDLIFVGSPSENLTLLEIPGTHEFVFSRVDSGTRKGDLAVKNVHPQPGESKFYLASPSTEPLTEDYAVIAFLPGLNPARSMMIIAGTTTFGTQGGVEFVSGPDTLEQLLPHLPVSSKGNWEPFEALLHIKVAKGVPVESELITVRKRSQEVSKETPRF